MGPSSEVAGERAAAAAHGTGELAGRAAIVTGGTRGIGRAVAKALAGAGADVLITGREAGATREAAAALRAETAGRVVGLSADQGSGADWTRVALGVEEAFGGLDILVLNAGVSGARPTAQMSLEDFRALNRVNLKGAFLGLKHGVAAMRRGGRSGSVAIVSSIVGATVGVGDHIHYAAAKAGVRMMAKAAALKLGPERIRVNTIHPGNDPHRHDRRLPTGVGAGHPDAPLRRAGGDRLRHPVPGVRPLALHDGRRDRDRRRVDRAMTGPLAGCTVVVTGATRGIGRAAALRLAGEGAHVVATGRSEADGAETVRQVEAAGGAAQFMRHDVTSEADWASVVATAEARGGFHGLVNSAGLFFVKPLEETTEADFDAIYAVNVEGTFLGVRHATDAFARAGRGGAGVIVSSLMGLVGYPQATAYCATKGAVTGMTKAAALDCAKLARRCA